MKNPPALTKNHNTAKSRMEIPEFNQQQTFNEITLFRLQTYK